MKLTFQKPATCSESFYVRRSTLLRNLTVTGRKPSRSYSAKRLVACYNRFTNWTGDPQENNSLKTSCWFVSGFYKNQPQCWMILESMDLYARTPCTPFVTRESGILEATIYLFPWLSFRPFNPIINGFSWLGTIRPDVGVLCIVCISTTTLVLALINPSAQRSRFVGFPVTFAEYIYVLGTLPFPTFPNLPCIELPQWNQISCLWKTALVQNWLGDCFLRCTSCLCLWPRPVQIGPWYLNCG